MAAVRKNLSPADAINHRLAGFSPLNNAMGGARFSIVIHIGIGMSMMSQTAIMPMSSCSTMWQWNMDIPV